MSDAGLIHPDWFKNDGYAVGEFVDYREIMFEVRGQAMRGDRSLIDIKFIEHEPQRGRLILP